MANVIGMAGPVDLPSQSKINRCGKRLAKLVFEGEVMSEDQLQEALHTIENFRAAHSSPLVGVRLGLASAMRTEGAGKDVSQRLKRVPRILRKLHRIQGSNLANLEDIAGARAVFATPADVERVLARIKRNWGANVIRERDYTEAPRAMGYRAKHVIVRRAGRAVEVQLRTVGQQQWADAIESLDARRSLNLKDGEGPEDLVRYFSLASDIIYGQEYGHGRGPDVYAEFRDARQAVIDAGYYSQ
jgi:putative GTP pyrophosphokinase